MTPKRSVPRIFKLLAVTVVSFIVSAIVLEGYARATQQHIEINTSSSLPLTPTDTDPYALVVETAGGRRLRPNSDITIYGHITSGRTVSFHTNSMGFRGKNLPPKQSNELRIMAIGDSITLQAYLPDEETYAVLLKNRLETLLPGRTVTVVNAGVDDMGIQDEVRLLDEKIDQVDPDIILWEFYLNDSRPSWGFSRELGHRGFLRRHSVFVDTIYRNLKLRKFIRETGEDRFVWVYKRSLDWKNDPKLFASFVDSAKYDWGVAWDKSSWDTIEKGFAALAELSQRRALPVLVVSFPVVYQAQTVFLDDRPQQQLGRIMSSSSFVYLDLLPILRKQQNLGELFFDQCHPTLLGNQLIVRSVSDEIVANILSNTKPTTPPSPY